MKKEDFRIFAAGWFTGLVTAILLWMICDFATAQTSADIMKELRRQKVPHSHIVLAQARIETGNFNSPLFRRTNNLFGMKNGERYARYKTWRDSIRDYKLRISSRYKGGSYYMFLKNIRYAEDPEYNAKLREIVRTLNH